MKKTGANPPVGADLRHLAEERLRAGKPSVARPAPDEHAAYDRSVYELQVHQIELEMQNEELRRVQHELEVALTEYEELYDFAPMGYLTLDGKGSILKVNLAGAVMLGMERSRLVGRRFTESITADTGRTFQEFLDTVRRDGKGSCDLALVAHAGRRVDVHVDGLRETAGQGQDWRCRAALTDITERKAAEDLVRAADRNKTEFLSLLSHELRNPLAPIRNSINLLERTDPGSEKAGRAKEIIARQTEHLTRLVEDLLDVTRISHGKLTLHRNLFDLRDVVEATAGDMVSLFDQGEVVLRVERSAGPVWVNADETRIAQIVVNLLQNAAKFTPRQGTVTVTVATRAGRAELYVRDTGVGMEPGQLERMFEPFAQADRSLARTQGGLGLGLALVRGLVESHGGSAQARTEGIGRGAEFVVTLPLSLHGPAAAAPQATATVTSALLILIIEDNVDSGQSLADLLELDGHRVRLARDARSGIELARELRPDVILCDIGLPDLEGYEVARTLRQDDALRSTRMVALSGYAQPEDRERSRAAGFDAHLAKPAALDKLWHAIADGR